MRRAAMLAAALICAACSDDEQCQIDLSTGECFNPNRCEAAVTQFYGFGCSINSDTVDGATFFCSSAEARLMGTSCETTFRQWRSCLFAGAQCGCMRYQLEWQECEAGL